MKDRRSRLQWTTVQLILTVFVVPSFFALGTAQDEASAVAVHMKAINQGLRELRLQLNDSDKTKANLALIAEVKKHLMGAQKEEPSKNLDLPESEREPFLKAYRAVLDEVISTMDRLEEAVKEERPGDAEALVKQLNDLKKEGHSKFQE